MHYKEEEHQPVREALALMLTDSHFKSSPQMSAFISYIVEQTLSGQADRIKAYTIAVDALGKPDNFDPQSNPSVRVLAKRLRDNLEQYYEASGRQASVKISIKPGSYVPIFEKQKPQPTPSHEQTTAKSEENKQSLSLLNYVQALSSTRRWIETRHRQVTIGGIMLMALFAWTLSGNTTHYDQSKTQTDQLAEHTDTDHLVSVDIASMEHIGRATDRPHLPRLSLVNNGIEKHSLATFGQVVSNFLGEYENFIVQPESNDNTIPVDKWPEDYELHYSSAENGNVLLSIKHAQSGRILNRSKIENVIAETDSGSKISAGATDTIRTFGKELVSTNGIILQDYLGNNDITPTMQCAFLFDTYYADKTRSNRQAAQRCATELKRSGIISTIPEIL